MSPAWPIMRRPLLLGVLVFSVVLSFGLTACGDSTPVTTPTSSNAAVTSSTAAASDISSTAERAVPTLAPALDPVATLPPAIEEMLEATILPDNVSPLTGLEVPDPAVLDRKPAAVKISNSPIVRPQSGLSLADIVIEHLTEGGLTRFTAVYQSQDAPRIGSVRSARLIDLEVPVLFDAFLVYSGATGEVNRLIESSDVAPYTLSDERSDPGFYRLQIPGRAYEHTLFTDTQLLWDVARENGWTGPARYRGWQWSEELPQDVKPAQVIEIPYSQAYSDVRYEYDPDVGAYRRFVLGEPHIDDLTGEQLTAPNVVILYVNHVDTLIVEDMLGSKSVEIQLWNRGRMQLLRDGVVKEGLWMRGERGDPLIFVDGNLEPIPLKPGQTWIQIVPLDMEVTVTE